MVVISIYNLYFYFKEENEVYINIKMLFLKFLIDVEFISIDLELLKVQIVSNKGMIKDGVVVLF